MACRISIRCLPIACRCSGGSLVSCRNCRGDLAIVVTASIPCRSTSIGRSAIADSSWSGRQTSTGSTHYALVVTGVCHCCRICFCTCQVRISAWEGSSHSCVASAHQGIQVLKSIDYLFNRRHCAGCLGSSCTCCTAICSQFYCCWLSSRSSAGNLILLLRQMVGGLGIAVISNGSWISISSGTGCTGCTSKTALTGHRRASRSITINNTSSGTSISSLRAGCLSGGISKTLGRRGNSSGTLKCALNAVHCWICQFALSNWLGCQIGVWSCLCSLRSWLGRFGCIASSRRGITNLHCGTSFTSNLGITGSLSSSWLGRLGSRTDSPSVVGKTCSHACNPGYGSRSSSQSIISSGTGRYCSWRISSINFIFIIRISSGSVSTWSSTGSSIPSTINRCLVTCCCTCLACKQWRLAASRCNSSWGNTSLRICITLCLLGDLIFQTIKGAGVLLGELACQTSWVIRSGCSSWGSACSRTSSLGSSTCSRSSRRYGSHILSCLAISNIFSGNLLNTLVFINSY